MTRYYAELLTKNYVKNFQFHYGLGLSDSEIARRMNCSHQWISQIRHRLGLPRYDWARDLKVKTQCHAEFKCDFQKRFKSGLSHCKFNGTCNQQHNYPLLSHVVLELGESLE